MITNYCKKLNNVCAEFTDKEYIDFLLNLKEINPEIPEFLLNYSFKKIDCDFGNLLSKTRNIPLIMITNFKGGENIPKNFRPICFYPKGSESKKLQRKINKKLKIFDRTETNQFASGKMYDAIKFVNDFLLKKEQTKNILFLDLKNAYGSVDYEIMKFILKNVNQDLYEIFSIIYNNPKVNFNGKIYNWNNGLFQGISTSPILFEFYLSFVIRNIKHEFPEIEIIAYIDDIVIIFEELNFEKLSQIFLNYGFVINAEKTKIINNTKINTNFKNIDEDFLYLGCPIIGYDKKIIREELSKKNPSKYKLQYYKKNNIEIF